MEFVLGLVAVSGLLFVALLVTGVLAARAAARKAGELAWRARLQARALAGGVTGEAARLQRDLAASVASARGALATAKAAEVPVGDAPALVYRLRRAARDCATELQLIQAVGDSARAAALLPAAAARVADVRAAAVDIADGLARAAGERAAEGGRLRLDCAIEADALRTGARAATA